MLSCFYQVSRSSSFGNGRFRLSFSNPFSLKQVGGQGTFVQVTRAHHVCSAKEGQEWRTKRSAYLVHGCCQESRKQQTAALQAMQGQCLGGLLAQ